jgi:hypothetical protein
MPSLRVTPLGKRVVDRWTLIPLRCLLLPGTVTWTKPLWGRSCQRAAALVWLNTASGPQASTAAIHLPFSLRPRWPTA